MIDILHPIVDYANQLKHPLENSPKIDKGISWSKKSIPPPEKIYY